MVVFSLESFTKGAKVSSTCSQLEIQDESNIRLAMIINIILIIILIECKDLRIVYKSET